MSAAEPDAGGAAAAAALGMGGAPAASAGGRCERPPLLPRVAASQGGGMLGKGVVGGGGGTKAPKPSFVSYVRPEVRRRRAGGASGRSGRGEGRREPLPCRWKGRERFLPVSGREAGQGEIPRGALGLPADPGGDLPAQAGRCPSEGPALWRPGEGARDGEVLRPSSSWLQWRGAGVWSTAGGEGLEGSGPPWGPAQSLQSGWVCPALGISQRACRACLS